MSAEDLKSWRDSWDALENTATDAEGPFTSLALASDAMITDGVSFIAEYPLVARRSVIFWEKPGHWEFSPLGKIAKETSIAVQTAEQVFDAIELVRTGNLPDRTEEIQALINAVRPAEQSAAKSIVGLVLEDYSANKA